MSVRDVRNNNPGSLRRTNIIWQGQLTLPLEMNEEQQGETEFCVFVTPLMGFRALALDLHTAIMKGYNTIEKLIAHYAPPTENDTETYILDVVKAMGVDRGIVLSPNDVGQMYSLGKAVATHESGWVWNGADLEAGVKLALRPNGLAAV